MIRHHYIDNHFFIINNYSALNADDLITYYHSSSVSNMMFLGVVHSVNNESVIIHFVLSTSQNQPFYDWYAAVTKNHSGPIGFTCSGSLEFVLSYIGKKQVHHERHEH